MKKIIFLLFIALTTFTSCSDDEDTIVGTLRIQFEAEDESRGVGIRSTEVTFGIATFGSEQDIKIELNAGHYIISPSAEYQHYGDAYVQVRPNRTTVVKYTKGGAHTVSY